MKIYKISVFILLLIISASCNSLSSTAVKDYVEKIPTEFKEKSTPLKLKAIRVVDYLPENYSEEGNVNYTDYVQKALDNSGDILMPNFPILVDSRGLKIESNTRLIFDDQSKVVMQPNNKTHYSILDLTDAKNVDIYFAKLEGDRNDHKTIEGEWGMGINLIGARNINVYAPSIMNTWGDGIYIGAKGTEPSRNINIFNPEINSARRNGISITSGVDVLVKGGCISNTHGTAPQSGLDIEPNRPNNLINNIFIDGLVTTENKGDGIMISLSPLTLAQSKKDINALQANIHIKNHTDIRSFSAFRINGRSKTNEYTDSKIKGVINIDNPRWIGNSIPIRFTPKPDRVLEYGFNPEIVVKNMLILNTEGAKVVQHKNVESGIINELKKM